ncbi:MAG TPA: hypothetical protein VEI04_12670 [Syntrophobacteria bacterium]|nr:hypothetical protein [Syntrophobacteria bacterium]
MPSPPANLPGRVLFDKASILAGFLMLMQNILSVVALSRFAQDGEEKAPPGRLIRRVLLNPLIPATAATSVTTIASALTYTLWLGVHG